MKNINRAVISGNMTRDPELRRTQSGMAILTIGVAVNDSRKDPQTGEWKDFPNFIDCTLFGNRAEGIANYLHKGTKVFIEGKLRWSSWERDGQKRSKIEIVIDEIEFDNKQQNGQQGGYQPQPAQQRQQAPQMQQGYYAPPQPQYQQQPQAQPPQMQPQPQPAPQQQQMAMPMQQQPVADTSVYDDDIPF